MTRLRKAARATFVAQIFHWVGLLLSLVTIPLYLAWLGDERYGLLLTGLALSSYLIFADAGVNWASMLLIAQSWGRDDRDGVAAIVRTSFPLALCSAFVVAVVVAAGYFALTAQEPLRWLPAHPEFPGLLLAIGASALVILATSPFYNLLIGLQEAHIAAIHQGIGRILGTIASVAIAASGAPLGWVFSGNIAAALLTGIFAGIHCRVRHPWAFRRGPLWDAGRVRQQLRTGAKSLVMQTGLVLWGTAPILAISIGAGAQFVPYFTIPYTLLNAPLSILSSFSACLQPGYGEAMGRGERQWIADTVQGILRQVVVVLGLFGVGFLLLAGPFVLLWTGDRIDLPPAMLGSVLAIAATAAVLTVYRYALTGINRHREAAVGEILAGALSIPLGILVVRSLGFPMAGYAVVAAALLGSAWLLPRELRRALGGVAILPPTGFWMRWAATVTIALVAGSISLQISGSLPAAAAIVLTGVVVTCVFVAVAFRLLTSEIAKTRQAIGRLRNSQSIPLAPKG